MKKWLIGIICALFVAPVYAASLIVQWEDQTPKTAGYLPAYYVEYKVTDSAGAILSTNVIKATETNVNSQIAAVAGNTVSVRIRASNVVVPTYPVGGDWTEWYTASPVIYPHTQVPIFTMFAY